MSLCVETMTSTFTPRFMAFLSAFFRGCDRVR